MYNEFDDCMFGRRSCMKNVKYIIGVFLLVMTVCTACGKAGKTEEQGAPPSETIRENISQEKLLSLPSEIGSTESLIMYNQTEDGYPLIYTIGQEGNGQYYYRKYVFDSDWVKEEAEFQESVKQENSNMIIQRVFCNNDKMYLVNATMLDEGKDYELSMYQYDKAKKRLSKMDFARLAYEDSSNVKYEMFDMQFSDNSDFVAAYNSGEFIYYKANEKKSIDYTQKLYGNFKVSEKKLYTSDLSRKKIIGIDLETKEVVDQFELELQQSGYNFCMDGEDLYIACRSGIYKLENGKAEQIINGETFTPYVLDDEANIVSMSKKGNTFFILFSRKNSYAFYSYAIE